MAKACKRCVFARGTARGSTRETRGLNTPPSKHLWPTLLEGVRQKMVISSGAHSHVCGSNAPLVCIKDEEKVSSIISGGVQHAGNTQENTRETRRTDKTCRPLGRGPKEKNQINCPAPPPCVGLLGAVATTAVCTRQGFISFFF